MHPFTKLLGIAGLTVALLVVLNIVTRPVQASGLSRSAAPVHHAVDRQNSEKSQ